MCLFGHGPSKLKSKSGAPAAEALLSGWRFGLWSVRCGFWWRGAVLYGKQPHNNCYAAARSSAAALVLVIIKGMVMHLFKNSEDEKEIMAIVNTILRAACRDGASQIFFEPHYEAEPNVFLVNFKVKEEVQLWLGIPKSVLGAIVSRLREMARMKTSEQQGVIQVRMKDKKHSLELNYDLRVEIAVTPHGEQVTLSFVDEYILN